MFTKASLLTKKLQWSMQKTGLLIYKKNMVCFISLKVRIIVILGHSFTTYLTFTKYTNSFTESIFVFKYFLE